MRIIRQDEERDDKERYFEWVQSDMVGSQSVSQSGYRVFRSAVFAKSFRFLSYE